MLLPLFIKLHQAGYEKGVTLLKLRKLGKMSGFAVKLTFECAL